MPSFDTILHRDSGDKHVEVTFSGEKPGVENGYYGGIEIDSVTDLSGAPVECTEEEYEQLREEAGRHTRKAN